MKTIIVRPESVGLAFTQQLGTIFIPGFSKSKSRVKFKRLCRALRDLDLISSNFTPTYLTVGTDSNGVGVILVGGNTTQRKRKAKRVKKTSAAPEKNNG